MTPARVGTSGFVYPHWRGRFYPEGLPAKRWLGYYAERFDTVELNATFYRLPTPKSVEGWAAGVPEGFVYAVKGSRFITHIKRLRDAEPGLDRFFGALGPLSGRMGPVLWQLPPQLKPDPGLLGAFLALLPKDFEHVVELRNAEWYADPVYRVIEDAGASLCLHDLVDVEPPRPAPGRISYRRFHGAGGRYGGRYGARRLEPHAREIERLAARGVPCFAYFNNDRDADAVHDARTLLRRLGGPALGPDGPV